MKSSIAITLIVIVGIFGFISGYSIGKKSGDNMSDSDQTVTTTTETKAASGGYGAPAVSNANSADANAVTGTTENSKSPKKPAAPGYGQ